MKLIEEAEKFEPCYEYEHCKAPMLIEQLLEEIQTTNHRYLDLQQVCDDQDKQIATLKAALIRERERYLDDFIHQDDPCEDRTTGAVLQLARELPDIDWEDKQ